VPPESLGSREAAVGPDQPGGGRSGVSPMRRLGTSLEASVSLPAGDTTALEGSRWSDRSANFKSKCFILSNFQNHTKFIRMILDC
jgi:hypothetical protein